MKDNQFSRDSYFMNSRRSSSSATGRDDRKTEYAPMDEYTLLTPEEGAEALHLNKTLQAKVEELLYLHPEFDDEHVHVSESKGTVTLMGSVLTLLDKNLADSLVRELDGVVNVINLLEIETNEPRAKSHEGENFAKGLY
jgi:hypothetical protein